MFHFSRHIRDAIHALRAEAAEARAMAATFTERRTVSDLENYAAELEREAQQLRTRRHEAPLRRHG